MLTLEDAFTEMHGPSLHGFALLVALGEREAAERAAAGALAAGAEQAATQRHPERAAAWLRARALRALQHESSRTASAEEGVRREALAELGVEEAVFHGLAALGTDARAALVASAIERFDPIDIETILGAGPAATRRVIAEARGRYLRSVGTMPVDPPGSPLEVPAGELTTRVRGIVARAITAVRDAT